MIDRKEIINKLKNLGLEIYDNAKREYDAVVSEAENRVQTEKLRKRFNLENPYKFVLTEHNVIIRCLDTFFARHAKRYLEDDIFVFFGNNQKNKFKPTNRIKDLSDETVYEVLEIVDVKIPVHMGNQDYEVPCTALYCKVL